MFVIISFVEQPLFLGGEYFRKHKFITTFEESNNNTHTPTDRLSYYLSLSYLSFSFSLYKVEARLSALRRGGTIVAGHPSLSFEVQGLNTRQIGGSAPAVDEICVSMSPELDMSLKSKNYDKLNPAFHQFGY